MDWFERITGFGEEEYASTQVRLQVDGNALVNEVTGQRWAMGRLEAVSLAEVSTEPTVQTMSCCSTKPDFGRKRGV